MKNSIILNSILELYKDNSFKDIIFSYEEMIKLMNQREGWFSSPTVWNKLKKDDLIRELLILNYKSFLIPEDVELKNEILFVFKSGLIFTRYGIFGLSINELGKCNIDIYKFKKDIRKTYHKDNKSEFFEYFNHESNIYDDNSSNTGMLTLNVINILKVQDPNTLIIGNFRIKNIDIDLSEIKYQNGVLQGLTDRPCDNIINEKFKITLSDKEIMFFVKLEKLISRKRNLLIEQNKKNENIRLNDLNNSIENVFKELDKDGNGEVDVVEGDDFNKLLKKHQKSIVEIDRNYVQQFVKVSSYLKTKKGNIQSIFNSIKDTPNQEVLNEYVEILKDDIHTYNLILFNSLNMIVSLVEDDMITFYEIHEMFDTLNMFDSKHEKDVSQKLTNIGDGLKDLMYEVRRMGNKISNSIQELSYVTEESTRMLNNSLGEINSSLDTNNLLTMIQTYQTYKINKNTKNLRE